MVRPADNTVGRPYSPKLKWNLEQDVMKLPNMKRWSWIHKVQLSLNEQSELWKELYTWREFDIKSQFAIQYLEEEESCSSIHSFNNFIK